jgi:lantibiotic modifying enzyme
MHLRSIKSIGNYAYIEYLENRREVLKQDEAESFYYRMGKLLAIGSILHIGDGHMENIISDGGHPYWIDLEASFNTPGEMDGERIHPSEVEYTMLLQDINKRKGEWSVISGMQGGTGSIKSWVAAFALNDGSDEFTVRYRKLSNQSINNRLFLGGKIIFPEDYEEYIIQGFRDVAELIIRKKDSLCYCSMKNSVIRKQEYGKLSGRLFFIQLLSVDHANRQRLSITIIGIMFLNIFRRRIITFSP